MTTPHDLRVLKGHQGVIVAIVCFFTTLPSSQKQKLVQEYESEGNRQQDNQEAGEATVGVLSHAATTGKFADEEHDHPYKRRLSRTVDVHPVGVAAFCTVLYFVLKWLHNDADESSEDFTVPTDSSNYYIYDVVVGVILPQTSWGGLGLAGFIFLQVFLTAWSIPLTVMQSRMEKIFLGLFYIFCDAMSWAWTKFYDGLLWSCDVESSTWCWFFAWPCMLINLLWDTITCGSVQLYHTHQCRVWNWRTKLEEAREQNKKRILMARKDLIVKMFRDASSKSKPKNELKGLVVNQHCNLGYLQSIVNHATKRQLVKITKLSDNATPNELLQQCEDETYNEIVQSLNRMEELLEQYCHPCDVKKPPFKEFWLAVHSLASTIFMLYLWHQTYAGRRRDDMYNFLTGVEYCLPGSQGDCFMWAREFVRFWALFFFVMSFHLLKIQCVKSFCEPLSKRPKGHNPMLMYLSPIVWYLMQWCLAEPLK